MLVVVVPIDRELCRLQFVSIYRPGSVNTLEGKPKKVLRRHVEQWLNSILLLRGVAGIYLVGSRNYVAFFLFCFVLFILQD